jgi:sarcosine oxidase
MQSTRMYTGQSYEVIVIGLGLVGSSTLYEAAKILNKTPQSSGSALFSRKPLVLGIEQHEILHDKGSSHGESRITRQAIGEGRDYVSLAIKSQNKLKELQSKLNNKFGAVCYEDNTGVLIVGPMRRHSQFHGTKGFLQTTQEIASYYGIPHVNYDCNIQLSRQFPSFIFKEDEGAYLEKTMGILDPNACMQSHIHLAKQENAEVHTNEKVLDFKKVDNKKIKVITTEGEYITNKVIITTGPWLSNFLDPDLREKLTVFRQTVFYFEVQESYREKFMIGNFHPFIWDLGNNSCVYGFPIMQPGASAIKIGTESYVKSTQACSVDRSVSAEEISEMYENFIKPNFKGIMPICTKAFACLYTKTPDSQFLIDYLPGYDNKILFASTCSGHGAKHALAIGEGLAQHMLLGKSDENLLKFNLEAMSQRNGASKNGVSMRAKL